MDLLRFFRGKSRRSLWKPKTNQENLWNWGPDFFLNILFNCLRFATPAEALGGRHSEAWKLRSSQAMPFNVEKLFGPSWQPVWKKWLSCQWLSFSRFLAHGALNIFFLNPCRVNLSFEFLLQWEFLESLKLDFGLSYLFLCLFYFSFQFYLLRGFFYQCIAILVFLRDFWDFTLSTFNFLFLPDNVAWEKVAEITIIFGLLDQ